MALACCHCFLHLSTDHAEVASHSSWSCQHETLFPPLAVFTWNTTQARLDALKLATLAFKTAYPSHDSGAGMSKAEVEAFAASLQA